MNELQTARANARDMLSYAGTGQTKSTRNTNSSAGISSAPGRPFSIPASCCRSPLKEPNTNMSLPFHWTGVAKGAGCCYRGKDKVVHCHYTFLVPGCQLLESHLPAIEKTRLPRVSPSLASLVPKSSFAYNAWQSGNWVIPIPDGRLVRPGMVPAPIHCTIA